MIQTQGILLRIRGGGRGRNPVFALEMIQTISRFFWEEYGSVYGRNPVFALEMIQTQEGGKTEKGGCMKVAIQYSPWR